MAKPLQPVIDRTPDCLLRNNLVLLTRPLPRVVAVIDNIVTAGMVPAILYFMVGTILLSMGAAHSMAIST